MAVKAKKKQNNIRLWIIAVHIALGFVAYLYRPIVQFYVPLVIFYFIYRFVTKKDKEKEVLIACAYMTGAEVFFRMTKAMIFYETGKYAVILFLLFGMFYHGFKRKAFPYALYIVLLLPGVFVSLDTLSYDANFRTTVLFNLSGPFCLAAAAIYCYGRKISYTIFLQVLDAIVYPMIAMTVYVYFYTPDLQDVVTNTASNSATSGGYGPNQVATALGLGVFILFSRLLIPYKNKWEHFIMMFFLVAMAYRALLTFSRGGVYVAIAMAVVFALMLYFSTDVKTKAKLTLKLVGTFAVTFGIWFFALMQTGGLIGNRYSNEDALGREKGDITTGRTDLLITEIEAFKTSPVLGIGVGKSKSYHEEELGVSLPTHNEISRMLSEHGTFGILALLILLLAPIITKLNGRKNIYFYPLLAFWFLTVAHSSMRIAAPGFLYGLSLLHLTYGTKKKKNTIYRKQALQQREQSYRS